MDQTTPEAGSKLTVAGFGRIIELGFHTAHDARRASSLLEKRAQTKRDVPLETVDGTVRVLDFEVLGLVVKAHRKAGAYVMVTTSAGDIRIPCETRAHAEHAVRATGVKAAQGRCHRFSALNGEWIIRSGLKVWAESA